MYIHEKSVKVKTDLNIIILKYLIPYKVVLKFYLIIHWSLTKTKFFKLLKLK